LSAIGDCILTLPLLNALRDVFPSAYLAWVVEPLAAPLLEGHPALDALIVAKRHWLKSPREVMRLRSELREHRFEWSLDPQSLTKSAVAAWISGARRRIGLGGRHGRELSRALHTEAAVPQRPHVVDRSLELLKPLGVEPAEVRFDCPEYAAAASKMHCYLAQSALDRFALINVGATWPSKLWPPERFGSVARRLGTAFSLPSLIVWAGENERRAAKACADASCGHAVVAPATSLTELASLARRADLFLSADTGPLHLAAAVGTPCVGLYGPTRREVCGPYGPRHIAVQKYYQEGTCRQRRKAENKAMRAITVEDAFQACQRTLIAGMTSKSLHSAPITTRRAA
jgi:ADP-heptose:LPS heptosyltransferase